jgi:hypothetical protein
MHPGKQIRDSNVKHLSIKGIVNSSGYLIYTTYHTEKKGASSQMGTAQVVGSLIEAYQCPLDPRHPLPQVLV